MLGGLVLAVLLISVVAAAGWALTNWAVSALHQVTETARRVAQSHNLTERIGYTGPQEEVKERQVTVHRLVDAAPTAGDAVLLERLAQNLVENAVRHNQQEGEVWVTTRRRSNQVELVVANTGLVVPPYEIETIFEPFRRLHGDRLRSDRGSGLGLSIVRAIVEAHGGTVVARPREECGLTVTVELPAAEE